MIAEILSAHLPESSDERPQNVASDFLSLVRGAYFLTAYGALLTLWVFLHLMQWTGAAAVLMWPTAIPAAWAATSTRSPAWKRG